jgi:hypothetical protein
MPSFPAAQLPTFFGSPSVSSADRLVIQCRNQIRRTMVFSRRLVFCELIGGKASSVA